MACSEPVPFFIKRPTSIKPSRLLRKCKHPTYSHEIIIMHNIVYYHYRIANAFLHVQELELFHVSE